MMGRSAKDQVKKSNYRRSHESQLDVSDLINMHDTIHQQSEARRIKTETLKMLEEKRIKETAHYKKIQIEIERMKLAAEKHHKAKMDELEQKIRDELKIENDNEQVYLDQRRALAANSRKILEEQEKQLEIMREQIRKLDEAFLKQESQFLKLLQSCSSDMTAITDEYKKQFKDVKNFRETHKNSADGIRAVTAKVEALTLNLAREKNDFENELKARLTAQKEAEEKQKADAENAARQSVQNQPIEQLSDDSSFNTECFKYYNECRKLLILKKSQSKLLDETPELQQIRFALKFAINNSINLLNEKNKATLIDGYQKLVNLLSGQRISTAKGNVAITDHNEAADWCRLRIAEKIIDRCDKEPGLIFFAAALAIALWQKYPDFGQIFQALLYKECPFLMPCKPPMMKNQSNDDFLQSWGFRLKEDGNCESHTIYVGRTTKFAGLLAALWVTHPRRGDPLNPFGIAFGWKYFAGVLNSPPDTNSLHILVKVLEIAGMTLYQTFGKQFIKLMMTFRDYYLPAVQSSIDEETSALFTRLRDTIAKFFNENKFEEPQGKLVPGYW